MHVADRVRAWRGSENRATWRFGNQACFQAARARNGRGSSALAAPARAAETYTGPARPLANHAPTVDPARLAGGAICQYSVNVTQENGMTPLVLEPIAVLACAWFAGAAAYITAVEHPARLACGTEIAATEWKPSYQRATVMQASLAAIAASCGLTRGLLGGGPLWLWAGATILTVIPFTLIVIRPVNARLLDPRLDRRAAETRRLLDAWGRLHLVRTLLSIAASILFVLALTR
jgi:uncharacterized membrane protein